MAMIKSLLMKSRNGRVGADAQNQKKTIVIVSPISQTGALNFNRPLRKFFRPFCNSWIISLIDLPSTAAICARIPTGNVEFD